ncbi:MAG: toxin-antitoxin system YwqK family antitoxin [Bacteroidota bacterium]
MKTILGIIIFSFFILCFSQKEKTFKEFYPSGKLMKEVPYINNKMNGEVKIYYESGKLLAKLFVKNDKFEGKSIYFFKTGVIESEQFFKNNLLEGKQVSYFTSGKIKNISFYKCGKQYGISKNYFLSGKVASEWDYINDILRGRIFYETGELLFSVKYKDILFLSSTGYDKEGNLLNGKFNSYFNSGKIQSTGFYEKGIHNGVFKFYYESDKLEFEGFFIKGKPEGIHKTYSETGEMRLEVPYENGKINGIVTVAIDPIRGIMRKIYYKDGQIIKDDKNKIE